MSTTTPESMRRNQQTQHMSAHEVLAQHLSNVGETTANAIRAAIAEYQELIVNVRGAGNGHSQHPPEADVVQHTAPQAAQPEPSVEAPVVIDALQMFKNLEQSVGAVSGALLNIQNQLHALVQHVTAGTAVLK